MKMMAKYATGALVFVAIVGLAIPTVARAVETDDTTQSQTVTDEEREKLQQSRQDRVEDRKQRLGDTKEKVCEARKEQITRKMTRISSRGERHLKVFTTITDRVKAFYENKGKTLANYDALVADVATKKTAAEAAVRATAAYENTFDCSGDDPKGALKSFRTTVATQREAMKKFRTAIKNLIVGVKSVQAEEVRSND
jgi:TolA-binding protein